MFPVKEQRQQCWDSRDKYWQCLDENAPEHQSTSGAPEPKQCQSFRKLFQSSCPGQWVKHFDRKRTYDMFKERMEKGYDPLEGTAATSPPPPSRNQNKKEQPTQ